MSLLGHVLHEKHLIKNNSLSGTKQIKTPPYFLKYKVYMMSANVKSSRGQ